MPIPVTFKVSDTLKLTHHHRTAVVFAMQSWLAETPAKKRASTTPGYFSVAMASESGISTI